MPTVTITASEWGNPVESNEPILCDVQGGPANGRQIRVAPDPRETHLPAASVTVQVDNHTDARVVTVQYRRGEISDDTHRWVYRPAPTG